MKTYSESKNEQYLFSILDDEKEKISLLQKVFWAEWNEKLNLHFAHNGECIDIKDYTCVMGGFVLHEKEMRHLDDGIKLFFNHNGKLIDGHWVLRGYDYYSADPLMYLDDNIPNDYVRWQKVVNRWAEYKTVLDRTSTIEIESKFVDWIACLSLLEYIFNDLTTMYWAVKKCSIDGMESEYTQEEILELEDRANMVAEVIVDLLLLNFPLAKAQLIDKIRLIVEKPLKITTWDASLLKDTREYVRAIREADSIPLIYAAFIQKLLPWSLTTSKNVFLLSNAFGALNVSLILSQMLSRTKACCAGNIHFSQNRLDHALFGEGSDTVKLLSTESVIKNNTEIVIVDDCIFTGKSYNSISAFFAAKGFHTMMLPLSLDIESLKYYRNTSKSIKELIVDAKNSILIAEMLNKMPPTFVAFWEWEKKPAMVADGEPAEYLEVINGGDLLRRELWVRYKDDILTQRSKKGL